MSTLRNKSYMKRDNRFDESKTKFVKEKYSCIQMKQNLKSIKIESLKFTNFVKSQGTQKYKSLISIYKHICKDRDKELDDLFITDEVTFNNNMHIRLNNIIEKNIGKKLTNKEMTENVRKCSYKNDTAIRLYFYIEQGNVLNLILVDLFHLAIYSTTSQKYDYNKVYKNNENNSYDIKNIAQNS